MLYGPENIIQKMKNEEMKKQRDRDVKMQRKIYKGGER